MDAKLREMEVDNQSEQRVKQELQDGRCSDLEVRGRKLGDWCSGFESKVQIADSNGETFEARYRALEVEKMKIEHELELLKKENTELKERISNLEHGRKESHEKKNANKQILVDLTEPNEDEELVMVNMVLQVDKENAEKNAAMWKQKYEELSMKMDDKGGHEHEGVRLMVDFSSFSGPPDDRTPILPNAGTPPNESKQKYKGEAANQSLETAVRSNRRAKKQLLFEDNNGIAPQTPSVSKPVGIIDISDSDDDLDPGISIEHDEKDGREEMTISFTPTNKRKRPSKVVNSDTESDDDDDDNLPISTLKKPHHSESPENKPEDSQTPVRRRIRTLREVGETSRGIPTTKDTDSDDSQSEDAGLVSDSEGDSLGGFIVDDDDNDDDDDVEGDRDDGVGNDDEEDDGVNNDDEVDGVSNDDEEDGDINIEEIMSTIRRSKDWNWDWKLEGDMLAAIGKDPVLCMKAVCAIYRQQTADEKVSKVAYYANGRGFSKFDAFKGCQLGEFLTCGDPEGDLKVSVEQLLQFDAKGVDICRNLALRYSKQLFVIFQSREDRFFRCSETEDRV